MSSTTGTLLTAVALSGALAAGFQEPRQPRYVERVDVSRVVVDVRVLDDRGNPIVDLTADDFKVKIDGKPVRVESARWVGDSEPPVVEEERLVSASPLRDHPPSPGRLIVFLFQKDMEAHRIVGLMQMLIQARGFLETLTPDDRVAILSFDSHLKVWVDFTNNLERLARVLKHGILFERPPPVHDAVTNSLVARLAAAAGRRTYSIEKGLRLIAEALEPLPGSKSLVLFGHGFGRFSRGMTLETSTVAMENGYEETVKALLASRTSVFSLDVTKADYHSLEVGLQLVSEQTGGFYARTHIFPELAMRNLAGALAGYYVLLVEKPTRAPRTHDIKVELTRRKGNVLAKSGFE
ncbi:MAG: VWA domain-containing protein [Vicinamibacterales bacterium]